jgi:hypothetical protein
MIAAAKAKDRIVIKFLPETVILGALTALYDVDMTRRW